jgi:chromosome segregation ATPase
LAFEDGQREWERKRSELFGAKQEAEKAAQAARDAQTATAKALDASKLAAAQLEEQLEGEQALAAGLGDELRSVTAARDEVAGKLEAAETEAAAQQAEAQRAVQSEAAAVSQRDHALAEADAIAKAFSAYKANDKTPQLLEEIERLKKDLHEASQALQFADLHPALPLAEITTALTAGMAVADGPIKEFGAQLQTALAATENEYKTVRALVDAGNGSVEVITKLGALQARAEVLADHARAFAGLVS